MRDRTCRLLRYRQRPLDLLATFFHSPFFNNAKTETPLQKQKSFRKNYDRKNQIKTSTFFSILETKKSVMVSNCSPTRSENLHYHYF